MSVRIIHGTLVACEARGASALDLTLHGPGGDTLLFDLRPPAGAVALLTPGCAATLVLIGRQVCGVRVGIDQVLAPAVRRPWTSVGRRLGIALLCCATLVLIPLGVALWIGIVTRVRNLRAARRLAAAWGFALADDRVTGGVRAPGEVATRRA